MASYSKELRIAQLAVQRAAILTKHVFQEKAKEAISKTDSSPVTIGDFGAQALIIHAIKKNFPEDQIMGEEETSLFRNNTDLRELVWSLVKNTSLSDSKAEATLGGSVQSMEDMLTAIDQGDSSGGNAGRIWALDPIDGTKGFLRGGQYAICLALIVNGDVSVGVLGCPNLPTDDTVPINSQIGFNQTGTEGQGALLAAVSSHGATIRPLGTGDLLTSKSIHMRPLKDIAKAIFCESVEASHSSHEKQSKIIKELGISEASVRMDSQAKYASLAMGIGDIYLRLTTRPDYQEKIWDHAAGCIIVREAGGEVTDSLGRRLDFSKGRTLVENKGVIAASRGLHGQVLCIVKKVLNQTQKI